MLQRGHSKGGLARDDRVAAWRWTSVAPTLEARRHFGATAGSHQGFLRVQEASGHSSSPLRGNAFREPPGGTPALKGFLWESNSQSQPNGSQEKQQAFVLLHE